MKITDVKTWVVGNPPPGTGGAYFIFVRLTTDGNVVGYGEAYNATFDPHLTAKLIEDCAARYLVGRDPHDIETFFRNAYSSGFTQRPDVTMMGCVSALEMACWDIIGKEAGKPVYKLIGGQVHEALRTYTYLYPKSGSVVPADIAGTKNVYNDPDMAAATALEYVKDGFNAVKFDPAGPYTIYDGHQPRLVDIDLSERMVKAVREAVGTRADILFGTHGQFTASGALRMARALEKSDPLWFEEPVPPDMPEVLAARCSMMRANSHLVVSRSPPASCSPISAAPAASWKPRRSRPWPRPSTSRSRRIAIAARSSPRPISRWRRPCRTS